MTSILKRIKYGKGIKMYITWYINSLMKREVLLRCFCVVKHWGTCKYVRCYGSWSKLTWKQSGKTVPGRPSSHRTQVFLGSCPLLPVERFSLRNSSIFVVWILPSRWWCLQGKLMVLIPAFLQPSCPACPPRLLWSGLILSLPLRHILSCCTHSQLPLEELDHTQGFSVSGLSQLKSVSRL